MTIIQTAADVWQEVQDVGETLVVERSQRRAGIAPLQADVDATYDPGSYTVADVIAHLEANPDDVDAVLEAERNGKNRSTIIDAFDET